MTIRDDVQRKSKDGVTSHPTENNSPNSLPDITKSSHHQTRSSWPGGGGERRKHDTLMARSCRTGSLRRRSLTALLKALIPLTRHVGRSLPLIFSAQRGATGPTTPPPPHIPRKTQTRTSMVHLEGAQAHPFSRLGNTQEQGTTKAQKPHTKPTSTQTIHCMHPHPKSPPVC